MEDLNNEIEQFFNSNTLLDKRAKWLVEFQSSIIEMEEPLDNELDICQESITDFKILDEECNNYLAALKFNGLSTYGIF